MFERMRARLGAKTVAAALAVALVGGGVALALPDEAITGQETAAANQAAALAKATAAQENAVADQADPPDLEILQADGPPEVVVTFLADLEVWIGCIQDGAAAHADQQSNEETRIEGDGYDEADRLLLCGDKPVNPNDANGEDGLDAVGPPENAGAPENAGSPENAGPPEDAGLPVDAGLPDDAGPPEGAGPDS